MFFASNFISFRRIAKQALPERHGTDWARRDVVVAARILQAHSQQTPVLMEVFVNPGNTL